MLERKTDEQGRLALKDVFTEGHLTQGKVALCYLSRNSISVKMLADVDEEDKVLAVRSIDYKRRLSLPVGIRNSFQKFVVYSKNHVAIIEGID